MGFVTYEQDGYVGIITINRPEALNALNRQVLKDLDEVIDKIDLNGTRAVIVTGAGEKAFVAGADIGEMSHMTKTVRKRHFPQVGEPADPDHCGGKWLCSRRRQRARHEL